MCNVYRVIWRTKKKIKTFMVFLTLRWRFETRRTCWFDGTYCWMTWIQKLRLFWLLRTLLLHRTPLVQMFSLISDSSKHSAGCTVSRLSKDFAKFFGVVGLSIAQLFWLSDCCHDVWASHGGFRDWGSLRDLLWRTA